jgi:hypothetical protein
VEIPKKVSLVAAVVLATCLVIVAGAIAWGLIFYGEYETEQTATRSFVIDEDFTDVRKILVRREAAKQLVTMGGGSEYINQTWSSIGAELGNLQPLDVDWRVEPHGVLRVRTKDPYIGELEIDLEQEVVIERDFLHSEIELDRPVERLRDYRMTTRFERDAAAGTSRVQLKLTQRIRTDAPWFAHRIADRRVRESVEKALANQEAAIRELIAENIDDVPLLPLR